MSVPISFALIGKTINFNTHAGAILGVEIRNAKVLGLLDPGTAKSFDNIVSRHIQVYPYLPEGTPDSPYDYSYLKVVMDNGDQRVYGLPWIDDTSIELVDTTNIHVVLKGRGQSDITILRQALQANGFDNFDIVVKS
jgi:hypothetical protein